jgi:hypothetical protein
LYQITVKLKITAKVGSVSHKCFWNITFASLAGNDLGRGSNQRDPLLNGVPNGMKGVFEFLSQKYGGSYKLLSSMAEMIETSAASHMIFKFILNGILPVNRIETGNFKSRKIFSGFKKHGKKLKILEIM